MTKHFFKVVYFPNKRYLVLPIHFFDVNYPNQLPPSNVTLKKSDGSEWKVGVRAINDDYCISRGWQVFVQQTHICVGDFILFDVIDDTNWEITIVSEHLSSLTDPVFCVTFFNPRLPSMVIPSAFIHHHLQNKDLASFVRVSGVQNFVWTLKVERFGDDYVFTDGWSNLLCDMDLDFLILISFRLIDESNFHMTAFQTSCCAVTSVKPQHTL